MAKVFSEFDHHHWVAAAGSPSEQGESAPDLRWDEACVCVCVRARECAVLVAKSDVCVVLCA